MTNDNPILNSPYLEPKLHYDTDSEGSLDYNIVCKGIEKTLSKTEINDQAFDPLYGHLLPNRNKKGAENGGEKYQPVWEESTKVRVVWEEFILQDY